ncbi:3 -5 exonuclease helicase [Grosmannia clavigera kw1407]|uniref:3-5 exonuclease helicase n=1 Tax=Grosmannia clavigera (strain kw1407 / UAMH 11150) TaxID=655863 RepID=F0XEG4_GROCL|nr:3 -5 exonuclease helicase [Grosmannia clavigera kw1407]EFX04191.1 3 -5 exonuclease helicase [Grosmannia clavigera kw1407]
MEDHLETATETAQSSTDDAAKTNMGEVPKVERNRAGKKAAEEHEEGSDDDAARPPVTTLAYKMPLEVFRAAKEAEPDSTESFWSYAMYRHIESGLPVKVHYCKSLHTTERVCREYFEGEPLLGFDLEWMMNAMRWHGPRRNVCLVQLASPSRIGLFHLSLYPVRERGGEFLDNDINSLVAPTLRRILEDAKTIKTGVCIKGDATRLRNHLNIDTRGMIELSHLHKLVRYSRTGDVQLVNRRLVPLAVQVQEHLRLPMFKGADVRSGDWSKPLNTEQIIYSASDAYAAVQIFSVLERERLKLRPTPPRPAFAELDLPIRLADGVTSIRPGGREDGVDAIVQRQSSAATPRRAKTALSTPTSTPRKQRRTPAPKTSRPRDARIDAADEWLAQYRSRAEEDAKLRTRPSSLRAYHLWHRDETLDPVAVASLLREPPLLTATVVSYILDAVRHEDLPYDRARLREELLGQLPVGVVMLRYRQLAKTCGFGYFHGKGKSADVSSGTTTSLSASTATIAAAARATDQTSGV